MIHMSRFIKLYAKICTFYSLYLNLKKRKKIIYTFIKDRYVLVSTCENKKESIQRILNQPIWE